MKLSSQTIALLEDIERRLDPETETDFENQWRNFLFDRFDGELFSPERKKLSAPTTELDFININDAVSDYELMLRREMNAVSWALGSKSNNVAVRANYGTGILSSVFGAEIFMMARENNTLPTTRVMSENVIRKRVEQGLPDIRTGFGKKVFEFAEFANEALKPYPKIREFVRFYHPDLQGPLDICELIWGGELFYALYDDPDFVHSFLTLICDTYEKFMKEWFSIFPAKDINPHWHNLYFRGKILVRNDSAMNLSPDLYDEFARPYDKRLLDTFDGGMVHFCGRGDHYIQSLCSIEKLYGINMSQPEFNDMEKIYQNTVDKKIKIVAFNRERAFADKNRKGGFHHSLSLF